MKGLRQQVEQETAAAQPEPAPALPDGECCARCRAWSSVAHLGDRWQTHGICRRFAPRPTMVASLHQGPWDLDYPSVRAIWPITEVTDWCAEYLTTPSAAA